MRYLPISLNTKNSIITILGNGKTTINKLRLLIKTNAIIHLFSSSPSIELIKYIQLFSNKNMLHFKRNFNKKDLNNTIAIFSCEENLFKNQIIAKLAKEKNIPFNSPDNPTICTFYMPSIVDRYPVIVAISTEGTAPVLAKKIRAHLEQYLPQDTGKLAIFAKNIRQLVQTKISHFNQKKYFWENFFNGKIANLFHNGNIKNATKLIEKKIKNQIKQNGKLYLIHASDPDLLSIKAARILQLADYIYQIENFKINIEKFINLARRDAYFLYIKENFNKYQNNKLIIKIIKQVKNGEIIIMISNNTTKKRKDNFYTYLHNKNVKIEHLYSAKSTNTYKQSINSFQNQYL